MNEAMIRAKLDQLRKAITSRSPARTGSAPTDDALYVSADGERCLDEALDQIRVQVKYLVFDLEATRRENHYLRQMLDSRRNGGL